MSFIARLEEYTDRPLIVSDDQSTLYYSDLLELAGKLATYGLNRRLAFCLCTNEPGALFGYLALLKNKAIPAMLNDSLLPVQLRSLIDAYQPEFIWLPLTRTGEIPEGRILHAFENYVLLAVDRKTEHPIHDDLALLMATSGSTGSPRFVRQSQENISSNAESIATYLCITADERPITTLPLSYTYGLSIIHSHLLRGCSIALTARSFFDRGFWDFLKSSGATSFGGVPYHYEMLKKLRFWRMDLPSLRHLTQAGGRMEPSLSQEVAEASAQRGIRFYTMYGQAEATARMAYLPPEKAIDKAGSIGQAIPGGELWLEDEQGNRIDAPDASGQLVFRGKNVTMGYASTRADLALGDENHGVLRTGDLARRDEAGDYYITGRQKRFLKLFGHRINLQDIEDYLRELGHDVACDGQDDHLNIYLCNLQKTEATPIKQSVADWLKTHPSALSVIALSEFPRNEAGKIRYMALASMQGEVLA